MVVGAQRLKRLGIHPTSISGKRNLLKPCNFAFLVYFKCFVSCLHLRSIEMYGGRKDCIITSLLP
jgi:hypothetical protein